MANSIKLITSLFFCGVVFLSAGVMCQSVPAIYIFGDSLVDVGNNNHLPLSLLKANFPHNGVDFPTGQATGRFSNGKNAADFLGMFC
ncbi:putative triacylglycerol lipase [Helianthus annuus]|nr:putative triacylglycerol lipase [Helianthus annuus]